LAGEKGKAYRATIVMNLQFRKHPRKRPDASAQRPDAEQPWPEAEDEIVYYDRSYSTLRITDDGVREQSAMDFRLGPPIQRVVRAVQDFEAWRALPVFLLAGFCLTSLDTMAKWLRWTLSGASNRCVRVASSR